MQVVVGDDDALDEVVVHLVLERLHVVGDRRRVAAVAVGVGDGRVGQQVGHAAEVGLLADRQLERRDAGAERSVSWSRVRSNDGPLRGRAC